MDIEQDDDLTLNQKKTYICTNIRTLQRNRDDLIDIGKTLKRGGYGANLKEGADGSRINLDCLGENSGVIINQLYAQIKHKIDNKK